MSMFLKKQKKTKGGSSEEKRRGRTGSPPRMTSDPGAPRLKRATYFQFPKDGIKETMRKTKDAGDLDDVFFEDCTQCNPPSHVPVFSKPKPRPRAGGAADDSDSESSEDGGEDDEETLHSQDTPPGGSSSDSDDDDQKLPFTATGGIKMPGYMSRISDSSSSSSSSSDSESSSSSDSESDGDRSTPEPDILRQVTSSLARGVSPPRAKPPPAKGEVPVISLLSSEESDSEGEPSPLRAAAAAASQKRKHTSSSSDNDPKHTKVIYISSGESEDEGEGAGAREGEPLGPEDQVLVVMSQESCEHYMATTPPVAGNPPYNWPWL
ncbi:tegument protein G45 [Equid gammaherpesvirus 2]|nr:tegument protein G45 [Equid gammaherpesvirus 2]